MTCSSICTTLRSRPRGGVPPRFSRLLAGLDFSFLRSGLFQTELSKMIDGRVPFPMISDAGGRIGAVYGAYNEAAGVNIRGRFIIDPDFVIRAMEVFTTRGRA